MIITCEKCSKKFNIQDHLIPPEGRFLQCGSCNHKWFYKSITNKTNLEENEGIIRELEGKRNKFTKIVFVNS